MKKQRKLFILDQYFNILKKNKLIIFSLLKTNNLKKLSVLKKELKKSGFVLKSINNKVYNILLKNTVLKNLLSGNIYLIYRKDFSEDVSDSRLIKSISDNFLIIGFLYDNKYYNYKKIELISKYSTLTNSFEQFRNILFNYLYLNLIQPLDFLKNK